MDTRGSESAFSLRNRLDEFQQFQEFCRAYQHGIRNQRPPNALYASNAPTPHIPRRATTFIYAFFVFNDIYKIDWQTSLGRPEKEPVEWKDLSQQEMFWKLTAYCFSDGGTDIHSFSRRMVEYCHTLGVDEPERELSKIPIRRNNYLSKKLKDQYAARKSAGKEISAKSIEDFQASFDALCRNGRQSAVEQMTDGLIHINNVLYFVYLVRCSVFHGRKELAIVDLDTEQDVRLAVYAAILMAMNQVVIDRATRRVPLVGLVRDR